MVLTLGSPPKKGGKKNKKNPSINPGQRHLKYTEAGSAIECKARTVMSQTDRQTNAITIIDRVIHKVRQTQHQNNKFGYTQGETKKKPAKKHISIWGEGVKFRKPRW